MSVTLALFTFTSSRSTPAVGAASSPAMLLLVLSAGEGSSDAPFAAFRPRVAMTFCRFVKSGGWSCTGGEIEEI